MNQKRCPYLGLREDPSTALDFPSDGNRCFQSKHPIPVQSNHQQDFCLSGGHEACPLYQAARARAVPPALVAKPAPAPQPARFSPAFLAAPLLVAALVMAGFAITRQNDPSGLFGQNTGLVQQASTMHLPLVNGSGLNDEQEAIVPATGGSGPVVSGVSCPLPEGYVPYTVNPTDSLFRLSILHGITVEEIRKVNCLADDAVIMPSQVIYVPRASVATLTPFAASVFPTSIPQRMMNPAPIQLPAQDHEEDDAPTLAPVPPTAVIDVAEDPTQAPPPAATEPPPPAPGGNDDEDDDDRGGGNDDDGDDDDRGGGNEDDDDDEKDKGKEDDKGDKEDKGGGNDDGGKDKGGGGKKGKD